MEAKQANFTKWLQEAGLSVKKHQISGIKFCLQRECGINTLHGVRGGILADEMGLGKTILMLGCVVSNFAGVNGETNTLVVLPLSLLNQWVNIFERFMGHTPLVYHGSSIKDITLEDLKVAPVVITTYGMIAERISKDSDSVNPSICASPLWAVKWNRVVMDEAHHIRNMDTACFKGARMLRANIRWLVTGTPIQNKATDFYALCSVLGFEEDVYTDIVEIRKIIRTHLLKRTKKQVGIKLPPIQEEQITVPWGSESEKDIAKQIHSLTHFSNVNVDNVDDIISSLARGHLPAFVRARQVCVFPHLLETAIKRLQQRGLISSEIEIKKIKTCSKMTAVAKRIINGFKSKDDRRKIVFCHYNGEIELLKALLEKNSIACQTITGKTTKAKRETAMNYAISSKQFSSVCRAWRNSSEWMFPNIDKFIAPRVLIAQIQTANEGLNLQHFQDIYFTSPHWNPAVEEQAIARAHRIGQTSMVRVYRFIMEDFDAEYEGQERPITMDRYCQIIQEQKRELIKMLDE